MRVIVAGGREFTDYSFVSRRLDFFTRTHEFKELVWGFATGVDTLGKEWADLNGIPAKPFKADWDKFGKPAGPMRNEQMAEYGDWLVAFWNGKSSGTKNMIDEAFIHEIGITIYSYE